MKPRPFGSFARSIDRVRKELGEVRCATVVGKTPALIRKWCDPDHESLPNLRQAMALDLSYIRAGLGEPRILSAYADQLQEAEDAAPVDPVDPLRFMFVMQATLSELAQSIVGTVDARAADQQTLSPDRQREILAIIEKLEGQTKRLQRLISRPKSEPQAGVRARIYRAGLTSMSERKAATQALREPIGCHISRSLAAAIEARRRSTGETVGHVVRAALAQYLQVDHATLFQVSTSGALVEGLYQGEVTVGVLKEHGDHGLGTFDGLDGEMVVVDGRVYQVTTDGAVREVDDGVQTPFALVTRFRPERRTTLAGCDSFAALEAALDPLRPSDNHFYAIRINGTFARVRTRAVRPAADGTPLAAAAGDQGEFTIADTVGTLVGFWAPAYAARLTIAGYHLHFLTADRRAGGHLFDCQGEDLDVAVQHLADFHLILPESAAFLEADLARDPAADLDKAERAPPTGDGPQA